MFSVLAVSGCASPEEGGASAVVSSREANERRAILGEPSTEFGGDAWRPTARAAEASSSGGAWSIALEFFSGPSHDQQARQRAGQLAAELGRSDITVRSRPRGSAVSLGSYDGPEDPAAQRDLDWIHGYKRRGEFPYALAFLAPPPPPPADDGSMPEFNLANATRTPLGTRALYSLQVAVFERPERSRAKREAEARVLELRRQGEAAYYFHGPTQSMVTIGAFGSMDFDERTMRLSRRVLDLQGRYPHNLLNGDRPILEADGSEQPSMLVRIPGSP